MPLRSPSIAALTLALLASACAASPDDGTDLGAGSGLEIEANVDPVDFPDPAAIDNPYWPLEPGTRWTWKGHAFDDGERVARHIVFTMTDLTKTIAGITTAVGWERDIDEGELLEGELIFLAQDADGNVWHFGQYTESWDGREFAGGSAWLVGHLEGAEAGVMMPADPTIEGDYAQGLAPPPYYWDDRARFERIEDEVCVKAGCYEDVVVVREFEPTHPNVWQLKYWAKGVGNIKVGWGGKDDEREEMELVKVEKLSESEMAEVRAAAFELETRANVYGSTPPLQQRP